jgi:hypothetical protein
MINVQCSMKTFVLSFSNTSWGNCKKASEINKRPPFVRSRKAQSKTEATGNLFGRFFFLPTNSYNNSFVFNNW